MKYDWKVFLKIFVFTLVAYSLLELLSFALGDVIQGSQYGVFSGRSNTIMILILGASLHYYTIPMLKKSGQTS